MQAFSSINFFHELFLPRATLFIDGCISVLGARLTKRFNISRSHCYGSETSASQIGSRAVRGVNLYSVINLRRPGWPPSKRGSTRVFFGAKNYGTAGAKCAESRATESRFSGVTSQWQRSGYSGGFHTGEGPHVSQKCVDKRRGSVTSDSPTLAVPCIFHAAAGIWWPDFGFTRVFA
jgi:hypothetical protein